MKFFNPLKRADIVRARMMKNGKSFERYNNALEKPMHIAWSFIVVEKFLTKRIKKQEINKIFKQLKERDRKDARIDKTNKEKLVEEGLGSISPKRFLEIDTGKIKGIENVAEIIKSEITPDYKIITLEGMSGAGSSTTAEKLQEDLGMMKFSLGEIFRYLTYKIQNEEIAEQDIENTLENFSYQIEKDQVCLYDCETNITQGLGEKLRSPKIDSHIPEIASLCQKDTIQLMQKEIAKLKNTKMRKLILIEGRSFTLDFIPSDMRVKLTADPSIRAERRWAQRF
jgi:cytidylate kinase